MLFLYENLLLYKAYQEQVFGKKLPKIQISHAHTASQILENLQYYVDCFMGIIGEIPHFFQKDILQENQITKAFFENENAKNTIIQLCEYINNIQFSKINTIELNEFIHHLLENKPDFLEESPSLNYLPFGFLGGLDSNCINFVNMCSILERNTKILQIFTKNPAIFHAIYTQKKLIDSAVHFQTLQNIYTISEEIQDFRTSFLVFALQNMRNISYPKALVSDFLEIDFQKKYEFLVGKNEFEMQFLEEFGMIFCDFSAKNTDFFQKNFKNYFLKIQSLLKNKGVLVLIFDDFSQYKKDFLGQYLQNETEILSIINYENKTIFILRKNTENTTNIQNFKIRLLKIKNDFNIILNKFEKYKDVESFYQKIFLKNTSFEDADCTLKHISKHILLKNIQNIDLFFEKSDVFFEIFYQNESLFKPLKNFFEVKQNTIFIKNNEKNQEKKAFFIFENITNSIEKIENFAQKSEFLQQKNLFLALNSPQKIVKIPENVSLVKDKNQNIWLLENDFLVNFIENEDDFLDYQEVKNQKISDKKSNKSNKSNKIQYKKQIFCCDISLEQLQSYPFTHEFVSNLAKLDIDYLDFQVNNTIKNSFFVEIFPKEKPFFCEKNADENVIFSENFFQILPKEDAFFENIYLRNCLNSAIFGLVFYENLQEFLEKIKENNTNSTDLESFLNQIPKHKISNLLQKTFQEGFLVDILAKDFEEISKNPQNKDKEILKKIGFESEKEMEKICKNLYKTLEEKAELSRKNMNFLEKKLENNSFFDKNLSRQSKENIHLQAFFLENLCKNLKMTLTPTIDFLQKLNPMFVLLDITEKKQIQNIIIIFWKNVFSENFNLKVIEKRNQQKLF